MHHCHAPSSHLLLLLNSVCSVGRVGKFGAALNFGYLRHVLGDLEIAKYLGDQAFERDLLGKLAYSME